MCDCLGMKGARRGVFVSQGLCSLLCWQESRLPLWIPSAGCLSVFMQRVHTFYLLRIYFGKEVIKKKEVNESSLVVLRGVQRLFLVSAVIKVSVDV